MSRVTHYLVLLLLLSAASSTLALDPAKFYAGHFFMYERSERFASALGGAVTYLTPRGNDEINDAPDAVLIEGVLSPETVTQVQRLISNKGRMDVYLDSPGGDLNAGIALGQLFRRSSSITVVNRGAQCKSACALAFLGGARRLVLGDSQEFGFHRQYRIVGGKITYGAPKDDEKVIEAYLGSIGFRGVTAEEIITTTGLATFSESSLKDRGVVDMTGADLRALAQQVVAFTGLSPFEVLSLVCTKYDRPLVGSESMAVMADALACGGRVPALREPLLTLGSSMPPTTAEQDLEFVSLYFGVLRSSEPSVIEAFNVASDHGSGRYQVYLSRRRDLSEANRKYRAP